MNLEQAQKEYEHVVNELKKVAVLQQKKTYLEGYIQALLPIKE